MSVDQDFSEWFKIIGRNTIYLTEIRPLAEFYAKEVAAAENNIKRLLEMMALLRHGK